ncbi:MAG TPA: 5'-3' exonuclease H3TH domain-containing protein [Steroidobacteraceae bacterium]
MLYLVDASVYVFRAWYSMPPDIQDAEGNPTHALYGFARFLADLIERRSPAQLAVAFDESLGNGHRHRLYPAYKANREPAPPPLHRQFALCREFCRHLGVAEFASLEYEADDLIGTLAAQARQRGMRFTVVSRDKDLSQLLGPGDVFWDYATSTEYRYEQIAARFGVAPERMADFLALMGDSVDNIPGVPGVGEKTALALMSAFDSLDALYANLAACAQLSVRGAAALPKKLGEHRDAAYLARSLTRICCEVPIADATPEQLRPRAPDLAALGEFCRQHGFGPMLGRQAERIATRLGTAA